MPKCLGPPAQVLIITVHIRLKGSSAAWLIGAWADTSSTHLASPMCLKTSMGCMGWCTLQVEQCHIDSRLTGLFKITRELLSVNSHWLLGPVMRRIHHSHSKSFIPLQTSLSSEYLSFFSRTIIQWNNLSASVFSKHCSLDTFFFKIYLFVSLIYITYI